MDTGLLKKSANALLIFLLTYAIFLAYMFLDYNSLYDEKQLIVYSFVPLLFFLIIFYYLFKFQKDEYHYKNMFWKIPLRGAIIGLSASVLFTIYGAVTCSGEECMGVGLLIFIGIPLSFLICGLVSLILTFNAWFKTNLYTVAWTIFVFALVPVIILKFIGQGLEEPAVIIPFGFIAGTILAVIVKNNTK